jgi:hypothetical protein
MAVSIAVIASAIFAFYLFPRPGEPRMPVHPLEYVLLLLVSVAWATNVYFLYSVVAVLIKKDRKLSTLIAGVVWFGVFSLLMLFSFYTGYCEDCSGKPPRVMDYLNTVALFAVGYGFNALLYRLQSVNRAVTAPE